MKTFRIILMFLAILAGIFVAILAFLPSPPEWTGFGEGTVTPTKESAKTLWDWLDLLIIPIIIAIVAWVFKESEKERTNKSEEERTQNDSLDSFFNIMTELITKHNLATTPNLQTKVLARARINIAFDNLNGPRKGQILQFLYQSNLIDSNPKLKLLGVNLRRAVLDEIVLGECEIKGAYFNDASIQNANLNEAIFVCSDFSRANFEGSTLNKTDMSYCNLTKAKLRNMDLTTVNFLGADMTNANLRGSTILQSQLDNIHMKKGIKLTKKKIK